MPKKTAAPSATFQWPILNGCDVHKSRLEQCDPELPGVFVARNVFPASVCARFVKHFSSGNVHLVPSPPAKKGEAQRTNERFQVDDPAFADMLWCSTAIQQAAQSLHSSRGKQAVGLNPNIRVYRYQTGTYFGPHYDDDFFDPVTKRKSEYTLLLYLTGTKDGLKGGATSFYLPGSKRKVSVEPEAGTVLFHKHGADCLLHEGERVTQGEKWILRSDVMFA